MAEENKKIYILLIRTQSIVSKIIYKLTKERYTHACIAMQADCKNMYSFGRRYQRFLLPAGFVSESIEKGLIIKHKNTPCALFELEVSEDTYMDIKFRLMEMYRERWRFHYSLVGLILCYFKYLPKIKRPGYYFCSQFVVNLLESHNAIKPFKPAALYHPNDFTRQEGLYKCYEGTVGGLVEIINAA